MPDRPLPGRSVLFLGAGASHADGAPQQSEVFRRYFRDVAATSPVREEVTACLYNLFHSGGIGKQPSPEDSFPTFEEALGVLELAEERGEEFRGVDLARMHDSRGRIATWRLSLVFAMAETIARSLEGSNVYHRRLIANLRERLESWAFITTNYDVLLDNALAEAFPSDPGAHIDYGFDYRSFAPGSNWAKPGPGAVPLLKLHGSLNWLRCRACNQLSLTPYEKGALRAVVAPETATCAACRNRLQPVIVPPSYQKKMEGFPVSQIWDSVDRALRGAERVVFCGYSLPDADLHIKYLLLRAVRNTTTEALRRRIWIFNWYERQSDEQRAIERERFRRLLGRDVHYERISFEQFADDPIGTLQGATAGVA